MTIPRNRGDVVNGLAIPSSKDQGRDKLFCALWKEKQRARRVLETGNLPVSGVKTQKHPS